MIRAILIRSFFTDHNKFRNFIVLNEAELTQGFVPGTFRGSSRRIREKFFICDIRKVSIRLDRWEKGQEWLTSLFICASAWGVVIRVAHQTFYWTLLLDLLHIKSQKVENFFIHLIGSLLEILRCKRGLSDDFGILWLCVISLLYWEIRFCDASYFMLMKAMTSVVSLRG